MATVINNEGKKVSVLESTLLELQGLAFDGGYLSALINDTDGKPHMINLTGHWRISESVYPAARFYLKSQGQTGTSRQVDRLCGQLPAESILMMATQRGYTA